MGGTSLRSIFLVLAVVGGSFGVTIMSIDFGSEWMKIAVVAPGVPMEIALNKESKRKTPIAVSFRDGERTFGEDALTSGIRYPPGSFIYLLDLLGKKIDNPIVELYKKRFPYFNIEADPDRRTVVFRYDEKTAYSVEELVAQLLSYARETAEEHTDQKIKDCVLTVPPFFNQAERRSILTAAELAGLKVLSLMSSNAAVALNYGMFRRKEINNTAQNILFYDMGASSTTATIVSYQTIKTKEKGYSETNPQVSVLGLGYDRTLGGLEMQLRLRDYLARRFNEIKRTPNNVYDSPRAMAKLFKEAGRLKKVLSANTEHLSQIEGLLDEEDFKLHVKREEFEDLCVDVFDRVKGPVDSALISSGMDISAIDQFIIVGGATRIPKIQMMLQDVWGHELGKNINADEAAAMGAVYRAADLGQGFKVKKFHVKEAALLPIEVDFDRQIENEDGSIAIKTVKRSLFALGNGYPQKKVMTFNKHTTDFSFYVNYGDLDHLPKNEKMAANANNITHVIVSGVTSAFQKHLQEGSEPKGIKAHFNMDDSGVLSLGAMEAVFEKSILVEENKPKEEESTLSKLGSTISKLFSGSEDEKENKKNKTEESDEKPQGDANEKEEKEATQEERKVEEKVKEESEKELKPKLVMVKEDLNFTVKYLDVLNLSPENLKLSKKKLTDINAAERARNEKAAARNTLESYILDAQEKLWQEEFEKASTEEQRAVVRELCTQLDDWIYDEGFDEEALVYKDKLSSLKLLFEPIKERVQEHHDRPEAIQALLDQINGSSMFLQRAREAPQDLQLFTEVEMTTVENLIIDTQKWLEEKEELQENAPLYETPKLLISEIAEKMANLDREIKYLVNKGKIVKAKKDREAAEAKAKAEKEAKEAEKEKTKKKNSSYEGGEKRFAPDEENQDTNPEMEVQDSEEDVMSEEHKVGEGTETGSKEQLPEMFQEESQENNSEEDRRKGSSPVYSSDENKDGDNSTPRSEL